MGPAGVLGRALECGAVKSQTGNRNVI